MSIFSRLFKKKDRSSLHEDTRDDDRDAQKQSFRRGNDRRSVHISERREYGADSLPSFYQSVGKRYNTGTKSYAGEPVLIDDERDNRNVFNHSFDMKRNRRGGRTVLTMQREERSSDYSSQDPSPSGAAFRGSSRHERRPFYNSALDDTDDDNNQVQEFIERMHQKLRQAEVEKQRLREAAKDLKNQKKNIEAQLMRTLKDKAEVDDELKRFKEKSKEESAMLREEINRLRGMAEYQRGRGFMPHHFPQVPPSHPPLGFPSIIPTRPFSEAGTDPCASILSHDGAAETLWDPSDTSFVKPFNNSMGPEDTSTPAYPFPTTSQPQTFRPTPLLDNFPETPRSSETMNETRFSSASLNPQQAAMLVEETSSVCSLRPLPLPPRRSSSDPALSPPRK